MAVQTTYDEMKQILYLTDGLERLAVPFPPNGDPVKLEKASILGAIFKYAKDMSATEVKYWGSTRIPDGTP